jgi:hypothetical protein
MPSGCARILTSSISITTFRAGSAAGHEKSRSVQDGHGLCKLYSNKVSQTCQRLAGDWPPLQCLHSMQDRLDHGGPRSCAFKSSSIPRIAECRCRGDFISMGTGSMFSKHSISGADLTTATSRSGATMVCIFFASTKPAPNGT